MLIIDIDNNKKYDYDFVIHVQNRVVNGEKVFLFTTKLPNQFAAQTTIPLIKLWCREIFKLDLEVISDLSKYNQSEIEFTQLDEKIKHLIGG